MHDIHISCRDPNDHTFCKKIVDTYAGRLKHDLCIELPYAHIVRRLDVLYRDRDGGGLDYRMDGYVRRELLKLRRLAYNTQPFSESVYCHLLTHHPTIRAIRRGSFGASVVAPQKPDRDVPSD